MSEEKEEGVDLECSESSRKSSSSSIYSSPSNTPTRLPPDSNCTDTQAHQSSLNGHNSSPQIDANPTNTLDCTTASFYEQLIEQTKKQMTDKFEQLEIETGLVLNNDHILTYTGSDDAKSTTSEPSQGVSCTHTHLKDLEFLRMEKELRRVKEELRIKNEIVDKMCRIRSQVESELEDLTASLFEEANKMVYKANVLRDRSEKELYEANLKIDMLTAEVQALKLLVITSTPSKPNAHLHPQLTSPKKGKPNGEKSQKSVFPVKSPSNYELGDAKGQTKEAILEEPKQIDDCSIGEIDPIFFEEFTEWKKSPSLEAMNSSFMKRIYDEEIYPVLNFKNKNLTAHVVRSIENNSLTVENMNGDKLPFPKKCALLEAPRICRYRMKVDDERWYAISHLCRNRIIAICDLFCYLRYIQNGLVKSSLKEVYWQIMRRRRNIAHSKLGFHSHN